jgi:hypothetical protein
MISLFPPLPLFSCSEGLSAPATGLCAVAALPNPPSAASGDERLGFDVADVDFVCVRACVRVCVCVCACVRACVCSQRETRCCEPSVSSQALSFDSMSQSQREWCANGKQHDTSTKLTGKLNSARQTLWMCKQDLANALSQAMRGCGGSISRCGARFLSVTDLSVLVVHACENAQNMLVVVRSLWCM